MRSPLISIVIPCFRQGHLLPQAIESALHQSYAPLETIVVNDGSDDDTEAVARRFGARIRYLWKPNGGLASARNEGLRAAEGRYLLFLDSDDRLHPDAVGQLAAAMNNADRRLAIMGYRLFRTDPLKDGGPDFPPPPGSSLLPWLIGCNPPVHAVLCPKGVAVEAGLFNEALRSAEDWDLWLRIAARGADYAPCPLIGAYYRKTPGSMSRNHAQMAACQADVLLNFVETLQADESAVRKNGGPILRSAYAIRRRFHIHRIDSSYVAKLDGLIRGLHRLGVRTDGPWVVRIQDRLPYGLTKLFETACLGLCRVARPRLYDELSGRV